MSSGYLIDTDILIDFFKQKYSLGAKFKSVGLANCFISEISLAELTYGALKSSNVQKQMDNLEKVKNSFQVIPISDVIERYSQERLRLERLGKRLPDFDLLIGVTAVEHNLILVTGNERHHTRIEGISIENWRKQDNNEFV